MGQPTPTITYDPADNAVTGVLQLNNPQANIPDGDELVLIPSTVPNSTILIDGGTYNVGTDGKIVKSEAAGGHTVLVNRAATFVVNGKTVGTDITWTEFANTYFEGVLVDTTNSW